MADPEAIKAQMKELAEKIGGSIVPMDELPEVFTALVDELVTLKKRMVVARQTAMCLLHQLGGAATIDEAMVEKLEQQYTVEHRIDSASDSIYLYLKAKS